MREIKSLHRLMNCVGKKRDHSPKHVFKELRDTTNFFLKNTYKSLQDLFSGSHYIETKKMASLIFLFSNILAREGVIIEQKSRKIA